MESGRPAFMSLEQSLTILEPQRVAQPGSNPLRKSRFIACHLRSPFLEICQKRLNAFLEPPGMCRLRFCVCFPQKWLCTILTRKWGPRQMLGFSNKSNHREARYSVVHSDSGSNNLLSFLLRCGARLYECDTSSNSNSLV